MSSKFGVGEYVTRDGRKAVVIADNMPNRTYPLIGWVLISGAADADADSNIWTSDGRYYREGDASALDLMPPNLMPPKPWSAEAGGTGCHVIYRNGEFKYTVSGGGGMLITELVDLLNAGESACTN